MSLHDMVANVICTINPMMTCQLYASTGSAPVAGGKSTPTFAAPDNVVVQGQQLTTEDLKHMAEMGMSGITRKVWCDTILHGIDRAAGLGGDKLVLPDSTIWLVVAVPEVWTDWCSALLQKQVAL
jgi:hypothetical protein